MILKIGALFNIFPHCNRSSYTLVNLANSLSWKPLPTENTRFMSWCLWPTNVVRASQFIRLPQLLPKICVRCRSMLKLAPKLFRLPLTWHNALAPFWLATNQERIEWRFCCVTGTSGLSTIRSYLSAWLLVILKWQSPVARLDICTDMSRPVPQVLSPLTAGP